MERLIDTTNAILASPELTLLTDELAVILLVVGGVACVALTRRYRASLGTGRCPGSQHTAAKATPAAAVLALEPVASPHLHGLESPTASHAA